VIGYLELIAGESQLLITVMYHRFLSVLKADVSPTTTKDLMALKSCGM